MYLKQLVIQGFKSFPDKTVVGFGHDITAIVGPNGSGKSNISDAIRWVMGEQNSRSLRGQKMEDVIFGGTEKRAPVGFAEATLVLDNSDRALHYDADELMVTRRYYRSGESEYRLNGTSCRLKDIQEIFYDTGYVRYFALDGNREGMVQVLLLTAALTLLLCPTTSMDCKTNLKQIYHATKIGRFGYLRQMFRFAILNGILFSAVLILPYLLQIITECRAGTHRLPESKHTVLVLLAFPLVQRQLVSWESAQLEQLLPDAASHGLPLIARALSRRIASMVSFSFFRRDCACWGWICFATLG